MTSRCELGSVRRCNDDDESGERETRWKDARCGRRKIEKERERESRQASGDAIFLGFSHRFKIDRQRRWRLILH